jgi:acyl dehydratase
LLGAENVTSFGGRFTSQVFPGDTLTGKLVVDSVEDGVTRMTVTTTNQNGVVVFAGHATGNVG